MGQNEPFNGDPQDIENTHPNLETKPDDLHPITDPTKPTYIPPAPNATPLGGPQ